MRATVQKCKNRGTVLQTAHPSLCFTNPPCLALQTGVVEPVMQIARAAKARGECPCHTAERAERALALVLTGIRACVA